MFAAHWRNLLLGLSLAIGCAGCAGSPPAQSVKVSVEPARPFELIGRDTRMAIDFSLHPPATVAYDLADDELCYLSLDRAIIVCAPSGSYLLFGKEDGIALVKDGPMARITPVGRDAAARESLSALETVTDVAGAVERLPDALLDYLDDPGPHRQIAIAVSQRLLADGGAIMVGSARGGTFCVSIGLTDAGREKLEEAVSIPAGDDPIYTVRAGHRAWPRPRPLQNEGIFLATPGTFPATDSSIHLVR